MTLSEARKKANAKWDKENMSTLSCKVKKDEAEAFKAKCAEDGKTINTVLRNFVHSFIYNDK